MWGMLHWQVCVYSIIYSTYCMSGGCALVQDVWWVCFGARRVVGVLWCKSCGGCALVQVVWWVCFGVAVAAEDLMKGNAEPVNVLVLLWC